MVGVVALMSCSCTDSLSASIVHEKTKDQVAYPRSESGDASVWVHEGVQLVDTLHVLHDTEWRVSLNVVLGVEPSGHLLVESPGYEASVSFYINTKTGEESDSLSASEH